MLELTWTPEQERWARQTAFDEQREAVQFNRKPTGGIAAGGPGGDFEAVVLSRLTEKVLADHLGRKVVGYIENAVIGKTGEFVPDIEPDIDVKRTLGGPYLNIKRDGKYPPETRFVLSEIKDGTVRYYGWTYARDAMKDTYWNPTAKSPCWSVPRDHLAPMKTLEG